MNSVDSLMLDAKQAILDEQHRRFQELQREGRVQEAMQQFHTTMSCATDLLNESLRMLEESVAAHKKAIEDTTPPPSA